MEASSLFGLRLLTIGSHSFGSFCGRSHSLWHWDGARGSCMKVFGSEQTFAQSSIPSKVPQTDFQIVSTQDELEGRVKVSGTRGSSLIKKKGDLEFCVHDSGVVIRQYGFRRDIIFDQSFSFVRTVT
jgi:hypothetical protein